MNVPPSVSHASARSQYIINWAATQCSILTSVDSDEPVQPPFKLTNSKRCSTSSLTLIKYSSDYVAKALISLCICAGWFEALLIVGNLMSRLNYILPRHRTQSRTFAYMINSWYPVCPWFDLARRGRSSGSKLFANFERERERERRLALAYESLVYISVLKMILGDVSHAHRLLHDKVGPSTVLMLCMLSIAWPNV